MDTRRIRLESSNGLVVAKPDGEVIMAETTYKPELAGHMPERLDVEEWKRNYPGEDPTIIQWDILDWAYWTISGKYEPAVRGDIA